VETMPPYYVPPSSKVLDLGGKKKAVYSSRNVNKYIEAFLKTDATHMWMLDADCEAPPHALRELLKLDVDVASGVTFGHTGLTITSTALWRPKPRPKAPKSQPYYRFLTPDKILGRIIKPPSRVATGAFCMLVRRRVFEVLHPKVKPIRFRWKEPQKYGIDIQFWTDAQLFGFTAAVHGGIVCGHLPEHPLELLENTVWCNDG